MPRKKTGSDFYLDYQGKVTIITSLTSNSCDILKQKKRKNGVGKKTSENIYGHVWKNEVYDKYAGKKETDVICFFVSFFSDFYFQTKYN